MCPMARYKARRTAAQRAIWLAGAGHGHPGSESPAPPKDFSSSSPTEASEEMAVDLGSFRGERPPKLRAFISHTPARAGLSLSR